MRVVMTGLLFAVNVLIGGCAQAEPMQSGAHPPVRLTAWHTYWDVAGGSADEAVLHKKLDAVSLFAVCYDAHDALYVPPQVREMAEMYRRQRRETYLSFTNDIIGVRRAEKDRALLHRLLDDGAAAVRRADEMAALAEELGVQGVELDYENFAKDAPLLTHYLHFTYRLAAVCAQRGLKLRIVLEPSVPFDAGFAKGPEYVVMLYNLHGKHSGPGAKADADFIRTTIARMAALPDKRAAAFAGGGCLWQDYGILGLVSGEKRFLTAQEAGQLAERHGVPPLRDAESAALHFSYAEDGHCYEVWYADSETLNAWITCAAAQGIASVSLWRLGGNTELRQLCTH